MFKGAELKVIAGRYIVGMKKVSDYTVERTIISKRDPKRLREVLGVEREWSSMIKVS
jgi:hypothetical protein